MGAQAWPWIVMAVLVGRLVFIGARLAQSRTEVEVLKARLALAMADERVLREQLAVEAGDPPSRGGDARTEELTAAAARAHAVVVSA